MIINKKIDKKFIKTNNKTLIIINLLIKKNYAN